MKKYFYLDNNNTLGPFTYQELADKKLSRNTMVWFEGQDGWKAAGDIPEVKDAFTATPPPPPSALYNPYGVASSNESHSKDVMVLIVLGIMLFSGILTFALSRLVPEWYRPPYYYIQFAFNIIVSVLPVLISLSIRDKNLRVIGLIISIILAIFHSATNAYYLITMLHR